MEDKEEKRSWKKVFRIVLYGAIALLVIGLIKFLVTYSKYGFPNYLILSIFYTSIIWLSIGAALGFFVGLLIYKRKSPIVIGISVGFITPILLAIISEIFANSFGSNIFELYLSPLLGWTFGKTSQGDAGLAYFAMAVLAAPFVYAIFGGMVGGLYLLAKMFIQKNRKNKYWLALIIILILLVPLLKPPSIKVSHHIPTKVFNPGSAPWTVYIQRNVLLSPFVSFEKMTIEQNGVKLYSTTLRERRGGMYEEVVADAVIDTYKIFDDGFDVGKKKTSTLNVYYKRYGIEHKKSVNFSIEVVE